MSVPVLPPGGGQIVAMAGDVYQIKLSGADTGGRCAVFEFFVPPGGGPGPHTHTREEEIFYVVEGELTFTVGGETAVVPAGGFLPAPRGVEHAFTNAGPVPARAVVVVSPAGIDDFFREAGTPWTDPYRSPGPPTPDDLARMSAAAPKYGLIVRPPPHSPRTYPCS